jgi:hypothetical protein
VGGAGREGKNKTVGEGEDGEVSLCFSDWFLVIDETHRELSTDDVKERLA